MVAQENHFRFAFSSLEVVLMGRFPHLKRLQFEGQRDIEIAYNSLRATHALDLSGRSIHDLSEGEKQRVFIARALAQETKIILLDEPTSFLDLKHRLQIYEILARLNRETGLTVLAISHDLNLAARYCRKLHLIREGAISASGTPAEVITGSVIREVYGTDAEIGKDPRTGTPFVIPYPAAPQGGVS